MPAMKFCLLNRRFSQFWPKILTGHQSNELTQNFGDPKFYSKNLDFDDQNLKKHILFFYLFFEMEPAEPEKWTEPVEPNKQG